MSRPPTTQCTKCNNTIMFDGMIRTPAGTCIPLNLDYSRHGCYLSPQDRERQELESIQYVKWLTAKVNKGLKHHKITIKIENERGQPIPDSKEPIVQEVTIDYGF